LIQTDEGLAGTGAGSVQAAAESAQAMEGVDLVWKTGDSSTEYDRRGVVLAWDVAPDETWAIA